MNSVLAGLLVASVATLTACASYERTRGVENAWRKTSIPAPVIGSTTQAELLRSLGPPSQVIGLRDQTVFYYLKEQGKGRGAIFIVYNTMTEQVTYDRAIFFFGSDGVLQDYAFSLEKIAP